MKHYVFSITTNYIDQLDKRFWDGSRFLYDVVAEDFAHAITKLPVKLPDDANVKLERTY